MNPVAGVDIGGTKIAVALDDGDVVLRAPTPAGADRILGQVLGLIRDAARGRELDGVGVGSAGTFDESGTVVASTDLIRGWAGTKVAERLAVELGVPVVAINDVHATALGEARAGAGRDVARILVASIGTGLGGAFVLDGTVDLGGHGSAGSLGHVAIPGLDRPCSCGLVGHAEPHASGPGIERTYAEAGGDAVGLPEIGARARAGEDAALEAIRSGGQALGKALAAAAALMDPDLIVVGGGPAQLGELLLEPVRLAYASGSPAPLGTIPIVAAELGPRAAIVGAHAAVRERLAAPSGAGR